MTQILKDIYSTYFITTYLGHHIVVNKHDSKTDVNLSKLVNKILGHYRFKELALTKQFLKIVNSYFKKKHINIHIKFCSTGKLICNLIIYYLYVTIQIISN